MKKAKQPRVGVGVIIFNMQGQILLGLRRNSHGSESWGPPGGHLEFGETPENCAIREVLEETGLEISSPTFLGMTNDFFPDDDKHYISILMTITLNMNQKILTLEPTKETAWQWFDLSELPDNLFLPIKSLLSGKAYGSKNFPT